MVLVSVIISLAAAMDPAAFQKQVEDDWFVQEQYHVGKAIEPATVQNDAAGGCDGVKDGKWGFHTGFQDKPWWQVDLGSAQQLSRVLLWNRCDAADRNNFIQVLLSNDGTEWKKVFENTGTLFFGFTDNKPLKATCEGQVARYVRVQLPDKGYLHLDEIEVFGAAEPEKNLALGKPATQCSLSQWSANHLGPPAEAWPKRVEEVIAHCKTLAAYLAASGVGPISQSDRPESDLEIGPTIADLSIRNRAVTTEDAKNLYIEARRLQRKLLMADPLLNFDSLLFAKRIPGSFNHMSDQYYGWWSRPGGGLFILSGLKEDSPSVQCVSGVFNEAGSFLRPALSYDGKKVLFAWCRYYADLAAQPDKLNKANVPEDAFYHVFEMNVDGTGLRQLSHGKYDDFDARYLPDGRIVFLSTRRGQFIQCGADTAALTLAKDDLPDVYVRCGGGPERPVAVYTLHTMNADGGDLCAISPFEMFEWTPNIAADGTILYSRWDYIDRNNMPYMSMWSIHPDGTNPRLIYGNYTTLPFSKFEPMPIPKSHKIIFTASAHHAQTMGSLVLLDPTVGTEGASPITRLTPDACFPEVEGWPKAFYTSPWPLSERLYLVAWGPEATVVQGQQRTGNGMGIYLFDSAGQLELLYHDTDFVCEWPIPLQARPCPPVLPTTTKNEGPKEGAFLLADVCQGLKTAKPGDIKALRIVAVPAKTHPTMNFPEMGLTHDDPGKCVLGTVPVEADGSAHFRVPAGVTMFFQALDARGRAIQTMRGATHVQPGQTLSCIGCHEQRLMAPPMAASQKRPQAAMREPSKITPGPPGSWPLRFDQLVQPVLDRHCVKCHNPQAEDSRAAKFDLTPANAYMSLVKCGKPSLAENIATAYARGFSNEGEGCAMTSPVLARLTASEGHYGVKLDATDLECLITWMDTYGQRLGSFSDDQEKQLVDFKAKIADLLVAR